MLGLLFVVLIVAFAVLNWPAFNAPTALTTGFFGFEAPLGLMLLGVMGVLTLGFVVNMAMWQGTVLLETRRHTKELRTQRALADQAEASRFTELRDALRLEFENLAQSTLRSHEALRTEVHESANSIAAMLGEIDDRSWRPGGDLVR
ncbi:MAG: LapA family protein [Roseateles sp.]